MYSSPHNLPMRFLPRLSATDVTRLFLNFSPENMATEKFGTSLEQFLLLSVGPLYFLPVLFVHPTARGGLQSPIMESWAVFSASAGLWLKLAIYLSCPLLQGEVKMPWISALSGEFW